MIEAGDSSLPAMVATAVLIAAVVAASVTDLRRRIIPNSLTFSVLVAGLAIALAADGFGGPLLAAGSGLAAAAPFWLIARVKPDGMGMGDVKLAAVIGAYLGTAAWAALLVGLAGAALTGMLISLGQRRNPAETTLPLAPFLAAGTIPVALLTIAPLI